MHDIRMPFEANNLFKMLLIWLQEIACPRLRTNSQELGSCTKMLLLFNDCMWL